MNFAQRDSQGYRKAFPSPLAGLLCAMMALGPFASIGDLERAGLSAFFLIKMCFCGAEMPKIAF